jgi:hypothetical protein
MKQMLPLRSQTFDIPHPKFSTGQEIISDTMEVRRILYARRDLDSLLD